MQKMDKETTKEKLAVIRVRGLTGVKFDIDVTLKKLKLYKKNYCVIVPKNQNYYGMIRKVKDAGDELKRQRLVGQLEMMTNIRQRIRGICHSSRWRFPE